MTTRTRIPKQSPMQPTPIKRNKYYKKQVLTGLLVAAATIPAIVVDVPTAEAASPLSGIPAGSTINFAGRDWVLLNPSTGYVISKTGLTTDAFDDTDKQTFDPHDANNIGYYLNNDPNGFYQKLSSADKAMVADTIWTFDKYYWTGAGTVPTKNGSNPYITAKVGLLSYDEAKQYMKTYSEYDGNTWVFKTGTTPVIDLPSSWFWLRTPNSAYSSSVWYVNSVGNLNVDNASNTGGSVRPALTLKSGIYATWDAANNRYNLSMDTSAPTINLSASTTSPTNQDVTVTATINDDGSITTKKYASGEQNKSYFATSGTTLSGTTFIVTTNGIYTVYAKDAAGNETIQTITISNIDKTAPTVTGVAEGQKAKQVTPQFSNATATLRKNGGAAYVYSSGTPVTEEGNYTLVVTDTASNITTVNFTIDTTGPNVNGVVNGTTYTTAITPTFTEGTATLEKDGGTASTYTSGKHITVDGSYKLTVKDALNNETVINFTIDGTKPTITLDKDSGTVNQQHSVKVEANEIGSGLKILQAQWSTSTTPNSGAWQTISSGDQLTTPINVTGKYYLHVRAEDNAGNVENKVSGAFDVDNTAPEPTVTKSTTDPTNQDVIVTITFNADTATAKYKRSGDATWTPVADVTTDLELTFSENDDVTIHAEDAAGNVSETTHTVTNIDTTPPTSPTATRTANEFTVFSGTDNVAVKETQINVNGEGWEVYSAKRTFADGVYTIEVKTIDTAGNESDVFEITDWVIYHEELTATTQAVETAETSKSQTDFDAAKAKVASLRSKATTAEMNTLDARLVVVEQAIKLSAATEKVVAAEASKLQADVTSAKGFVDALVASSDKTALTNRLASIQQELDVSSANTAVTNAETSKTQTSVNAARIAVEKVQDASTKEELMSRLDTVQTAINEAIVYTQQLNLATQEVVRAETTPTLSSLTVAKGMVSALKEGVDKTNLTTRLDAVQATIDAKLAFDAQVLLATNEVAKAEITRSQSDADRARALITALPNSAEKTALTNRITVVQGAIDTKVAQDTQIATQVNEAKTAMTQLEENPNPTAFTTMAQTLNSLPDSTDKVDLLKRLYAVQARLTALADTATKIQNATTALEQLERTYTTEALANAQTLVGMIPDGTEKTSLQSRLTAAQTVVNNKIAAAEALATAERSLLQADADKARTRIASLPEGQDKMTFNTRLAAVQSAIDVKKAQEGQVATQLTSAKSAMTQLEENPTQTAWSTTMQAVNALPESADKTDLLKRLYAVQATLTAKADTATKVQNATSAMEQLERVQTPEALVNAQTLVAMLPEGTEKSALMSRLATVQTIVNQKTTTATKTSEITTALAVLEENPTQSTYNSVLAQVNTLPEGTDKASLLARLTLVQNKLTNQSSQATQLTNAMNAVANAELLKTQDSLNTAKNLVVTLADSAEKTALLNRISMAQQVLNATATNSTKSTTATNAMKNLETTRTQADWNAVSALINNLSDGPEKTELLKRLYAVQTMIITQASTSTQVQNATKALEQLEKLNTQDALTAARTLINALPDSSEKIMLQSKLKQAETTVLTQVATQEKIKSATELVTKLENSRSQNNLNDAQLMVHLLPNGDEKTALLNRITSIQQAMRTQGTNTLSNILGGTVSVQDLANYANTNAYQELMASYYNGIAALGGTPTQQQITQIIRMVNTFEFAKRLMLEADVVAYEIEYKKTPIHVQTLYPSPDVLRTLDGYVNNEKTLEQMIEEIAIKLEVSPGMLQQSLQNIMQTKAGSVGKPLAVTTIGQETSLVRSLLPGKMLASINMTPEMLRDAVTTTFSAAKTQNVNDATYVLDMMYAVVMVKEYLSNPTLSKETVVAFITSSLHDGNFKQVLFNLIEERSKNYSKVTLTTVKPSVPQSTKTSVSKEVNTVVPNKTTIPKTTVSNKDTVVNTSVVKSNGATKTTSTPSKLNTGTKITSTNKSQTFVQSKPQVVTSTKWTWDNNISDEVATAAASTPLTINQGKLYNAESISTKENTDEKLGTLLEEKESVSNISKIPSSKVNPNSNKMEETFNNDDAVLYTQEKDGEVKFLTKQERKELESDDTQNLGALLTASIIIGSAGILTFRRMNSRRSNKKIS